ncbi:MAG: MFS transporter, partial [Steroidobacteraceae bacterium]
SQFGLVFAAALFGLLLGSLLVAPLADQVGRKPLAVGAAVWVGLATLTTAFCTTIPQVTAARFATGIGLGTRHRAYRLDRRPGAGRSRHRAGMVQCADSLSSRTCIVMRRRRCVVAGRSAPRE